MTNSKNDLKAQLQVLMSLVPDNKAEDRAKLKEYLNGALETDKIASKIKRLLAELNAYMNIDTLNKEFGLITASKIEEPEEKEPSDAEKALGILAIIAAIWWFVATDEDGPSDRGRGDGGEKVVVKDYKLTATVTVKAINDIEPFLSSLRVNFSGSNRKRSMEFFREFFSAIDKSIFLDEAIDDLS